MVRALSGSQNGIENFGILKGTTEAEAAEITSAVAAAAVKEDARILASG